MAKDPTAICWGIDGCRRAEGWSIKKTRTRRQTPAAYCTSPPPTDLPALPTSSMYSFADGCVSRLGTPRYATLSVSLILDSSTNPVTCDCVVTPARQLPAQLDCAARFVNGKSDQFAALPTLYTMVYRSVFALFRSATMLTTLFTSDGRTLKTVLLFVSLTSYYYVLVNLTPPVLTAARFRSDERRVCAVN